MESSSKHIEYDTSCKKYAFNKYYNCQELNGVSKRVFDEPTRARTIDTHSLRNNTHSLRSHPHRKKTHPHPRRKSANSKTTNSSRLHHKPSANTTITLDNYRDFNKQEIAEELHHYTTLSLQLRRENQQLKLELANSQNQNKESIAQLQRKLTKINEKEKEREKRQREKELHEAKEGKDGKEGKEKGKKTKPVREGEFKRFFLHFLDNYGRVDEKLQRKILTQKSLERKLVVGQRLLREGCDFLKEKKYKFNCIFD